MKRLAALAALFLVVGSVAEAQYQGSGGAYREANWNLPAAHWQGNRAYTTRTRTVIPVINRAAGEPMAAEAVRQWNEVNGTGHLLQLQIVQSTNEPGNCGNVAWHIVLCEFPPDGSPPRAPGSAFPLSDPAYFGHMHHCGALVPWDWPGVTVWLHEIGHCLGLQHHYQPWSEQNPSVMGGRQSLGPDDYWGIVKLYWHNDGLTPRWPDKRFLEHVSTGSVVDVPYSSTTQGENLITWGRHGGPNQQFVVEPAYASGWCGNLYRLVNVYSQHLLALDPNGVNVEQESLEAANADPASDEWWCFGDVGNGQVVWLSYSQGQYVGRSRGGALVLSGSNWQPNTWRIVT